MVAASAAVVAQVCGWRQRIIRSRIGGFAEEILDRFQNLVLFFRHFVIECSCFVVLLAVLVLIAFSVVLFFVFICWFQIFYVYVT